MVGGTVDHDYAYLSLQYLMPLPWWAQEMGSAPIQPIPQMVCWGGQSKPLIFLIKRFYRNEIHIDSEQMKSLRL